MDQHQVCGDAFQSLGHWRAGKRRQWGTQQIAEVMSGSSYYSQNDLRLHFGLGKAGKVDNVEIAWPSGRKESFKNLPANRFVTLQETKGIIDSRKPR